MTGPAVRVAIETATSRGSVAVARGNRLLAEATLGVQRRHAEHAVPALEFALRTAGVERTEIEAVVVGAGPGSFTGVRVAAATAKGLCAGLGVPLLAYPSLLALVAGVPAAGPVLGLFDARRGEVYAGCWRVAPDALEEVAAPAVGPAPSFVREGVLCVGDGALRYRDALEAAGAAVAGSPAYPRAATLLWLAEHHEAAGRVAEPAHWEPSYVRASSAERGIRG